MCILYCCEGRKLDNYWVITSPLLNKEYCIVLYCIVLYWPTACYQHSTALQTWATLSCLLICPMAVFADKEAWETVSNLTQ